MESLWSKPLVSRRSVTHFNWMDTAALQDPADSSLCVANEEMDESLNEAIELLTATLCWGKVLEARRQRQDIVKRGTKNSSAPPQLAARKALGNAVNALRVATPPSTSSKNGNDDGGGGGDGDGDPDCDGPHRRKKHVSPRSRNQQPYAHDPGLPVRILRLPAVIKRVGLARSTIYQAISKKEFPPNVSLGPRAVGWLESEIDDWLEARVATRASLGYQLFVEAGRNERESFEPSSARNFTSARQLKAHAKASQSSVNMTGMRGN